MPNTIRVSQVSTRADLREFIDLHYQLNRSDPAWIPPLRSEARGLLTPGSNPWFEHGEAAFLLAHRGGRTVGRISAHVDHLWTAMPVKQGGGRATGNWGLFEAADAEAGAALLEAAEAWLAGRGMSRSLGPISLSIWDEPGLLVEGHAQPPTVMMGHNNPAYEAMIDASGYRGVKDLYTYELDINQPFPALIQQIIAAGARNPRITIRKVDRRSFAAEAVLILDILNDAWSDNWGFVPLTDAEIAYAGKKLKPVIFEDLVRIACVDGEPVAFMMTLPDLNELQADLDGSLFPFGFAKLLWRLNGGFSGRPQVTTMRVPLMGVRRRFHASRLASQLAFMMIEQIREAAAARFNARRAEIGWILEDNQGMVSIARAIESHRNKTYRIYEKAI